MLKKTPLKSVGDLGTVRRQMIQLRDDDLVRTSWLTPDQTLPVVLSPAAGSLRLIDWARHHKTVIADAVQEHGAVLFRNFLLTTAAELEDLVTTVHGAPLAYRYRSTQRTAVRGHIYTSTEYPADQRIPQHNELSYAPEWPMKLWFFCRQAAVEGGATPIADSRKVFDRIPAEVREPFVAKGVMYVRNYGSELDLPWETVFQTSDRDEVEQYCRRAHIEFEWKDGSKLRTWYVTQAAARHPASGAQVWFNQAHLFHVSSLKPEVRDSLLTAFPLEELPRHAFYGDGAEIEDAALAHVRAAYDAETIAFPWQNGDLLLVDNMLISHGRLPFVGPREVLVGMAEPFARSALSEGQGSR